MAYYEPSFILWFICASFLGMLCSYLCGAVPFAIIIGKKFYGIDVREHGSGNTGTTNVIRTIGLKPGLVVLVLDIAKGAVGVLCAMGILRLTERLVAGPTLTGQTLFTTGWTYEIVLLLSALCTVIGHVFPIYIGFKGGKGAATALGAFLVVLPYVGLIAFAIFLLVGFFTRYVSLGTICAALSLPITTFLFYSYSPLLLVFTTLCMLLILIAHRSNIVRLMHHEESKFSIGSAGAKSE
ncbi:MAG: glycerol-3-phosphate 1-O-acyltransferase PlsY [Actinobacteria bacterium]|nr:glycerol-3-phosphate 1-O-acyltransferase PlsY [Actinomycetota bacterium]